MRSRARYELFLTSFIDLREKTVRVRTPRQEAVFYALVPRSGNSSVTVSACVKFYTHVVNMRTRSGCHCRAVQRGSREK